ncbi:hypothetical protein KKC17_03030 [Patescibacteria group bacterium]|nr:hypothetical protein [Patescibacteria group bacterium]
MVKNEPIIGWSPQINRWSKRLLIFFWLGFLLLASGLFFILLPIVTISIEPQIDQLELPVTVQVDLKLPSVLEKVGVVPGYEIFSNEEEQIWLTKNYKIFTVDNKKIAVSQNHLINSVKTLSARSLAPDLALVPEEPEVVWGQLKSGFAENIYNLPTTVKVNTYHDFPLADWAQYITGLPLEKTQDWLSKQLWVKSISIDVYPRFLAKIRQNMPMNKSLIRFRLDNNGKTSILQWRS